MREEQLLQEFLQKISPIIKGKKYTIPEPKFDPDQRKQRRLTFRNENTLYKRKSSLNDENIISFFHPESPFLVYSHEQWWSDKWDPMDYGADFNLNRGFFEQFYELLLKVPRATLINNKAENSPYCNFADGNKNCHMVTSANWNEDSYFCFCLVNCKNAVDCTWCIDSELLYECTDCRNCYNLRFSWHCDNCSGSAFLYDCAGIKNAIFCAGIRSAEYQIFNKPVSREYFKNVFDYYFSGSFERLKEAGKINAEFINKQRDLRKEFLISSENVFGSNIWNSKNIFEGHDVFDSQDCCFLHDGLKAKDCADICFFDGTELCYESTSLIGYGYRFTNFCRDSMNLFYCDSCYGCKDCFGCIGLRNKQYCILNRQYKKEQYEDLMVRIIIKMKQAEEWGEFFPVKHSLFAYNETLAAEYYPLSKNEIISRGWQWREKETKNYEKTNVKIPDSIKEVGKDFCDEILSCEITGKNYKLLPSELRFYKKLNLPAPRISPEQRLRNRLQRRKMT